MTKRIGQDLWHEWDGNSFSDLTDPVAYYTDSWISLDNEIVARALAYAMQRSDVTDSVKEGLDIIDTADIQIGFLYHKAEDEEILWHTWEFFDHVEDAEDIQQVTMVEFEIGD